VGQYIERWDGYFIPVVGIQMYWPNVNNVSQSVKVKELVICQSLYCAGQQTSPKYNKAESYNTAVWNIEPLEY